MEQKVIFVNNLKVNYRIAGSGPAILILHGWGSNAERWNEIGEVIAKEGFRVIIPDIPGFGKSQQPPEVWGIEEYAGFVSSFAKSLALAKFVLLGNSFGGQIAIYFGANNSQPLEKLILVAAAGVRREITKKEKALIVLAKFINIFISLIPSERAQDFIRRIGYSFFGRSMDYAKTKGFMRKIFVKVIRQDLSHIFNKITLPTLILWGDKDNITPLADAHRMIKAMPNSSLVVFPGIGHNVRKSIPDKFTQSVVNFLKST